MKLSLVERETILLYNQAEPMAEIYTLSLHDALPISYIRRKPERPTMPLWFWRTMDSTPTSSWNLISGKEAADEALFSGTGNHSPL